jgi:predicted dehydrogenase
MIRLGISGCGAVAQGYYMPAIAMIRGEADLVAAFDPNQRACRRFATAHGAQAVGSFDELLSAGLDLLIVASPPGHHPAQACASLGAGIAVLCEKPMALSIEAGERMVEAARSSGRPLAIGMVRRLLPQPRLIRALLGRQLLGELKSLDIFEGGPFRWPVASQSYFDAAQGGGVLEDVGIHVLDLLRWWFGEPTAVAFADDAMGGTAANCRIELEFASVRVAARLSRDWHRRNVYRFTGDAGALEWSIHDRDDLEAVIGGEAMRLVAEHPTSYPEAMAEQIRSVAAGHPTVTATDGLATVRLLERCRQVREPMVMEWL